MLKLTTDKHEASRGVSATAELLVFVRPVWWTKLATAFYCTLNIVSYHIISYNNGYAVCCSVSTERGSTLECFFSTIVDDRPRAMALCMHQHLILPISLRSLSRDNKKWFL